MPTLLLIILLAIKLQKNFITNLASKNLWQLRRNDNKVFLCNYLTANGIKKINKLVLRIKLD